MKNWIMITGILLTFRADAQELFVFTEPASNMAAKSAGVRLQNWLMLPDQGGNAEYYLIPEIMWGLSKSIMIHADAVFNNRESNLKAVGGGAYVKYRFLSTDDVHSHFRMACFARASLNKGPVYDRTINLQLQNSGYELGLIATALKNKTAFSINASWLRATDNGNAAGLSYDGNANQALAASLSGGRLMLPKEYVDYRQVNLNVMLELLGQYGQPAVETDGNYYMDLAPSLQLIIMSRMRVELGYRFPLIDHSDRMYNRGALLRLEYNFFNLY